MTDELRPPYLSPVGAGDGHTFVVNEGRAIANFEQRISALEAQTAYLMRRDAPARPDDATERARLEGEVARLREACAEAVQQIEYLHDKFTPTGSGNAVLARLKEALCHDRG